MIIYKNTRIHLAAIFWLGLAMTCQGCIGSAFKDDPDGQLEKDFGNLNSVPDMPPPPDLMKYQKMRQEMVL